MACLTERGPQGDRLSLKYSGTLQPREHGQVVRMHDEVASILLDQQAMDALPFYNWLVS